MTAPRLRMRVESDGVTGCGRLGCYGYFGIIMELVTGRRAHLVDPRWEAAQRPGLQDDDNLYWRLPRLRHSMRKINGLRHPGALLVIEPDAYMECPTCKAIQVLPPDVAEGFDPLVVGNQRIKTDMVRAPIHVDRR
jgi:hypothetical protein